MWWKRHVPLNQFTVKYTDIFVNGPGTLSESHSFNGQLIRIQLFEDMEDRTFRDSDCKDDIWNIDVETYWIKGLVTKALGNEVYEVHIENSNTSFSVDEIFVLVVKKLNGVSNSIQIISIRGNSLDFNINENMVLKWQLVRPQAKTKSLENAILVEQNAYDIGFTAGQVYMHTKKYQEGFDFGFSRGFEEAVDFGKHSGFYDAVNNLLPHFVEDQMRNNDTVCYSSICILYFNSVH